MGIFIRSPKLSSGAYDQLKVALLEVETMVPKGFLAVYVGEDMRRFVIPTAYLSLPALRN